MTVSMRVKAVLLVGAILAGAGIAAPAGAADANAAAVARARAEYWTPERMAAAIPRDLIVDERGRGYLRRPDGSLQPRGSDPAVPTGADGPAVTNRDPLAGATIGASHQFEATVTDADGVRSVSFRVGREGGTMQSFSATRQQGTNVWAVTISGFTDGAWQWSVTARDGVKQRGGNTTVAATTPFTVGTGGGGGGGGSDPSVVANDDWSAGGVAQTAVGRVFFEMPSNARLTKWSGYVCSGTVAQDGTAGRSVVITAAHCVYDDVYKAFARNVLFIPNQDATTGTGTDRDCSNDPLGCWAPSHGTVDVNWTNRAWPDNIPWDYAYYSVPDGAHSGAGSGGALDAAANALPISFSAPAVGASTYALGYSYSDDPNLMYCKEGLAVEGSYSDWWLASCGLSGGASGGPWIQSMDLATGSGSIISVNSWGYSNQPGMAGPRLAGTTAECLFDRAKTSGGNDIAASCP